MTIMSPYNAKSSALEVVAGHDLSGKTALITGANSGIGLETARALLAAGAEVIFAVRDPEKGEEAAQGLRKSTGNEQARVLALDLSSLQSVRAAAEQFLSRWSRLHILINNAGVMATPQSYTVDGFERQFGTNHIGHFVLAQQLLPALRAAAPSRVVALSSSGHRRSDIHFEDIQYKSRPYDKWEAYGQSKTADALFGVGFTHRFAQEGITANAVHPGGIHTELQRYIPQEEWRALGWIDEQGNVNPAFKTPEQGAATSVWAAVGKELEGVGGLYLEDCQESHPFDPAKPMTGYKSYALDPEHAERLWTASEKLVETA